MNTHHTSEPTSTDFLLLTPVYTIYSNPDEPSSSLPYYSDYVDSLISPTGKSALIKIADDFFISNIENNELITPYKLLDIDDYKINWAWNDQADQFAALVDNREQTYLNLHIFTLEGTHYQKEIISLNNLEIYYINDMQFWKNHLCIYYELKDIDRHHRMLLLDNKSGVWQVKENLPFFENTEQEMYIKKTPNAITLRLTNNTIDCLLLCPKLYRFDSYHFDENQQLRTTNKTPKSKPVATYPRIESAPDGSKIAIGTNLGFTITDNRQSNELEHRIKCSSELPIRAATFSQDGSLFVYEDIIEGKRIPIIYSLTDHDSPVKQHIHFKGMFSYDEYFQKMTLSHDGNHLITQHEKTITIQKKQGDHWEEEHVIKSPEGLSINSSSITMDYQYLLVSFIQTPLSDTECTPQIALYKLK